MMLTFKSLLLLSWSLLSAVVVAQELPLVCLPGDDDCAKCQKSCDAMTAAELPVCCVAYSACCPAYSDACKQCTAHASIHPQFPVDCCATFTDCCDMVPGLNIVGDFVARKPSKTALKENSVKVASKSPRPGQSDTSPPNAEEPQLLQRSQAPQNQDESHDDTNDTPLSDDSQSDNTDVDFAEVRSEQSARLSLPSSDTGRHRGGDSPRARQPASSTNRRPARLNADVSSRLAAAPSTLPTDNRRGRVTSRGRVV